MNRVSRYVAVISAGLLLPHVIYADVAKPNSLSEVSRILTPAFQAPSKNPQDIEARVQELQRKLQEQGVLDEKEQSWLDKVRAARENVDKAKASESLPSLLVTAVDQARLQANKALESLFPQLQPTPSGVNVSDLTSKEKSCSVDFSQYRAMADFLSSDPVKLMQQNGAKFLEDAKKDKAKVLGNLAQLAERLKRQQQEKFEKEQAGFLEQQGSGQLASLALSQEAQKDRIEKLKATEQQLKAEKFRRDQNFVEELFGKVIPALMERSKAVNEVRALAGMLVSRLQQYRQHTYNAGLSQGKFVTEACEDNLASIKQGTPETGISLLQTAVDAAQSKNSDIAPYFQQAALRATNQLSCRDTTQDLEATLGEGSPLKQQIDALSQATDAGTLLQSVMNFLPQINASVGALNSPLKESIKDCEKVAKTKKSVESFIQRVSQGAGAQQAGGAAGGLFSSRRRNRATSQAGANNSSLAGSPQRTHSATP